ncbi:MAG TPA: nuclear transport factor 2 family protein [Steroidobacteraceae bacterium]|nr:nuclear transport factor 2 family protein [Steroidobacteraceae bacterium]
MTRNRFVLALFVAAPLLIHAGAAPAASAAAPTQAQRLAALEDREAIRIVLRDYGRLLDERRFDEFGQLFAEDGEYVAGTTTRGPKAIADGLRRTFAGNSLGLAEPNFHVLFNERIRLAGDRAVATSQSFFVAPGADGAPRIVLMASYEDELVRTPAGWRFAKRVVRGNMAPRPPKNSQ